MISGILIGSNIVYSLSPRLWKNLGVDYKLLSFAPSNKENVLSFVENFDFMNITSPYKSFFTTEPKNLYFNKQFYNTDVLALEKLFLELDIYKKARVLVLGSGAMAEIVLKTLNPKNTFIKARNEIRLEYLVKNVPKVKAVYDDNFDDYDIILNTTPKLYNIDKVLDFAYDSFSSGISFAKKLLIYQALYAYQIMGLRCADTIWSKQKNLERILSVPSRKKKRIWLIGFMGVGKSFLGRQLADKCKYKFYDIDEFVVKISGLEIPQIFEHRGESYFREKELEVAKSLLDRDKAIIATGAGLIENFEQIKFTDEDLIVWFYQEFKVLKNLRLGDTRPLWNDREILFKKREPLYFKYANYIFFDSYNFINIMENILC